MSKTKIVCPQCGAEFAIPATSYIATGVILGADSNLGVIHPKVVGQAKPQEQIISKRMNAEEKLEALRNAGVDVDNLFSMKGVNGEETIARLENGSLSVVPDDDPIFAKIFNDGTIPNSQLFRRWVMAQVFHMLATGDFLKALQRKGYGYQWKMLIDELKAQAKMYLRDDRESLAQRRRYFNKESIVLIAKNYVDRLIEHINKLPCQLCKTIPYITLKGKTIFVEDVDKKVITPLRSQIVKIKHSNDPVELLNAVSYFYKLIKKTWLQRDTQMSLVFKDSYKGAGAYFTMRNMILFHGARFYDDNEHPTTQQQSLKILESKAEEYKNEGWRLFGVMKQLISDNGINIEKKIAEWRNNKAI